MARELDFVDECYNNEDLSLLKKLTLVIPTYNRNYYLSRCLWYHAHFPFGQIIVADSSPEDKKVVNRETVAKIKEMFSANVLYLEYQPESEKYGRDIYQKWGDAVRHVETDFVKLCTDREFVFPDVITECILFLINHLDYSTADGGSYTLTVDSDKSLKRGELQCWLSLDKSYEDSKPLERIENMLQNRLLSPEGLINSLTAVRRTLFQKYIYDCLDKYSLNDIRFGDLVPQYLSILCSKRKRFNSPYLVRDFSYIQQITVDSSYLRYPDLNEYKKMGILKSKENSLCQLTIAFLQASNPTLTKVTNDDEKKIKQIIHDFIPLFFPIGKKQRILKIYSNLPKQLQNIINYIYSIFIHKQIIPVESSKKYITISKIIFNTKLSYYSDSSIVDGRVKFLDFDE